MYDNAKFCIEEFCHQLGGLYGSSGYTFNSHSLLHLHHFVQQLGPLDNFSAFIFENYLYMLKQRIKSGSFVLSQTINSVIDIRTLYHSSVSDNLFFSDKYPNNCAIVLVNNKHIPIIVIHIDGILLCGYELEFVGDLYTYPYPSNYLGIGKFRKTSKYIVNMPYVTKCVLFVDGDIYYVVPFVNSSISNSM